VHPMQAVVDVFASAPLRARVRAIARELGLRAHARRAASLAFAQEELRDAARGVAFARAQSEEPGDIAHARGDAVRIAGDVQRVRASSPDPRRR
jgi:hypothetical protein